MRRKITRSAPSESPPARSARWAAISACRLRADPAAPVVTRRPRNADADPCHLFGKAGAGSHRRRPRHCGDPPDHRRSALLRASRRRAHPHRPPTVGTNKSHDQVRASDVCACDPAPRHDRPSSSWSTAMNASWGISTEPTCFIRFFPSLCRSSSLRFRVMSPP